MEKINISNIFRDHFKTLRLYDEQRTSFIDILLFYIVPIALGVLLAKFVDFSFITLNSTELLTFYSVFGGFMLNLLALIYGYDTERFKDKGLAKEVLDETTSNISYLIAVSSIAIFTLFAIKVLGACDFNYSNNAYLSTPSVWVKFATVAFFMALFLNFCLTILMILKRFYSLDSNRK